MFSDHLKAILIAATLIAAGPAMAQSTDQTFPGTPLKMITVSGQQAYAEWQRITAEGAYTPIIIGSDDATTLLAEGFAPGFAVGNRHTSLQYAWGLSHPESLKSLREEEWKDMLESDLANGNDGLFAGIELEDEEPLGSWPIYPDVNPGLLSLTSFATNAPYDEVHIVLLPIRDPARAPAYLRFGGWNSNPPPGYHVAALKSWQDRYGAVPVLISGDVIELRVTRRPETREEALALAREQFLYSEDIVYQGVGSISELAASMMVSDWWYFWWD